MTYSVLKVPLNPNQPTNQPLKPVLGKNPKPVLQIDYALTVLKLI